MISTTKRIFREGFQVPGIGSVSCFQTFESNIPFPLRYMIDAKIQGMSWLELKGGKYKVPLFSISTAHFYV